ncbi:MAG: hypothetical protein ABI345_14265 [Jatrophihabitans sp.]
MVNALCTNSSVHLKYLVIQGADHRASVSQSLPDVESWVDARMAGVRPAPSTC